MSFVILNFKTGDFAMQELKFPRAVIPFVRHYR